MSKQLYLLFGFILMLVACNNATTTPEEPTNQTDTSTVEQTPEPPAETTKATYKDTSKYAEEIALVEQKVAEIEQNLANYKEEEKTTPKGCKAVNYTDEEGNILKSVSVCKEGETFESWTFYSIRLGEKSSKQIYMQYTNGSDLIYHSYTIGQLIEGEEHFGLILDDEGNKPTVAPEFHQKKEMVWMDAS